MQDQNILAQSVEKFDEITQKLPISAKVLMWQESTVGNYIEF